MPTTHPGIGRQRVFCSPSVSRKRVMSNEPSSGVYRICQAMIEAGITDPNSQEGIGFCVNKCPYKEGCIVMESGKTSVHKQERMRRAWALLDKGHSIAETASIMNLSYYTIQRYISVRRKSIQN